MLMLGLETAGPTASVALVRDGVPLGELSLHHTRAHSETVMPMVDCLLDMLGVAPGELGAVAVDHGPGSFTGVRIGVCTANGLGQALGIPVVGVLSLRALFAQAAFLPGTICALLDARNESVYAAVYRDGRAILEPAAIGVGKLLEDLPEGTVFIGDGAQAYATQITQANARAILVPESHGTLRAEAVCTVAERLLKELGSEPFVEAAPVYLRPSQAERLREEGRGAP